MADRRPGLVRSGKQVMVTRSQGVRSQWGETAKLGWGQLARAWAKTFGISTFKLEETIEEFK